MLELTSESSLEMQVQNFMNQNHVSSPTPGKKKQGLRYRLRSLSLLHEQFMAERNQECHYSSFCSYVSDNVVKP